MLSILVLLKVSCPVQRPDTCTYIWSIYSGPSTLPLIPFRTIPGKFNNKNYLSAGKCELGTQVFWEISPPISKWKHRFSSQLIICSQWSGVSCQTAVSSKSVYTQPEHRSIIQPVKHFLLFIIQLQFPCFPLWVSRISIGPQYGKVIFMSTNMSMNSANETDLSVLSSWKAEIEICQSLWLNVMAASSLKLVLHTQKFKVPYANTNIT